MRSPLTHGESETQRDPGKAEALRDPQVAEVEAALNPVLTCALPISACSDRIPHHSRPCSFLSPHLSHQAACPPGFPCWSVALGACDLGRAMEAGDVPFGKPSPKLLSPWKHPTHFTIPASKPLSLYPDNNGALENPSEIIFTVWEDLGSRFCIPTFCASPPS